MRPSLPALTPLIKGEAPPSPANVHTIQHNSKVVAPGGMACDERVRSDSLHEFVMGPKLGGNYNYFLRVWQPKDGDHTSAEAQRERQLAGQEAMATAGGYKGPSPFTITPLSPDDRKKWEEALMRGGLINNAIVTLVAAEQAATDDAARLLAAAMPTSALQPLAFRGQQIVAAASFILARHNDDPEGDATVHAARKEAAQLAPAELEEKAKSAGLMHNAAAILLARAKGDPDSPAHMRAAREEAAQLAPAELEEKGKSGWLMHNAVIALAPGGTKKEIAAAFVQVAGVGEVEREEASRRGNRISRAACAIVKAEGVDKATALKRAAAALAAAEAAAEAAAAEAAEAVAGGKSEVAAASAAAAEATVVDARNVRNLPLWGKKKEGFVGVLNKAYWSAKHGCEGWAINGGRRNGVDYMEFRRFRKPKKA